MAQCGDRRSTRAWKRLRRRAREAILVPLLLGTAGGCSPLESRTARPEDDAGFATGAVAGWPTHGGDPGGRRHTILDQITPENVDELEVAWVYRTGDYPGARPELGETTFQATPILFEETLYFCSPAGRIYALDARTGEERWVHDAQVVPKTEWSLTCRGVALHVGPPEEAEACRHRVFMGTMDARLVAVDARTGRSCRDFGVEGAVDLRAGLGEVDPGETYMTSPPTVIGDVVVTGALVADGRRTDSVGGVIRGFDIRSGVLRWFFDPVPPGTPLRPPAADGTPRFHRGTPNAWSILSADPIRDLVFVPFGSVSPDYFGGLRDGFDHFANSVVALRGRTGELVWSFQAVHHDLWDYDVASQPVLIDVEVDGQILPAVAQATKMGHLFLLHRETGQPLYPVEERPVPQTDIPGEYTSPTQPFPTFPEPLHRARIEPDEVFGFTPLDRWWCRRRLAAHRYEGIFTPPSFEGSIQYPGTAGGQNWGSLSFDAERGLLVMPHASLAQVQTVVRREEVPGADGPERVGRYHMQRGTPYLHLPDVFLSPIGLPCSPTPWGTLLAVDLRTGRKRWEVPFGTSRDVAPVPIPLELGFPSMGGPITTASGLTFIAASMDDYLRAYETETGALLWQTRLPAGGQATPMSYRLAEDGRQYLVIAAGGHSTLRTTLGDYVIAYALPARTSHAR